MKKVYYLLKIFIGCMVGQFVGTSIYRCYDFYTRPVFYGMNSAPWYLAIHLNALFTAIVCVVLLLVLHLVKRRLK